MAHLRVYRQRVGGIWVFSASFASRDLAKLKNRSTIY